MEGGGVLLIATQERLLAIDVTKLGIRRYSHTKFPPLPVVKVFNFVEEGYSFGASFFKWESKLYMVGGETTSSGASKEEHCRPVGSGFDLNSRASMPSRDIFVSNLTTLDSISEFHNHSVTMSTEKPSPILAEFEGKIYVLSGPSRRCDYSLETPTFEVYDPSLGQMEPLPDPPFYINNNYNSYKCVVARCSVEGSSIYMLVGGHYYCYRIQDKKWDERKYAMDNIPVQISMLPGFGGQLVPGYDDIFICFRFNSLIAVMLRSDGGRPFQYINEVFDPCYRPDSFSYDGLVVSMGNQEMCIVKPATAEARDRDRSVVYVATFRVEKLHSSAPACNSDDSEQPQPQPPTPRPFVSVTCLSKGFYDLETWGRETPKISGAFFHRWE
ncbi:hypothetical protein PVL29_004869 [Vitis rotundifolia]|uniref:Uncharacterized protein n=1 Tax=Vitis rotundifolia TaxID=103349 RepID=A0AA39A9N8_VITRO|nr:hypothetical protein PVL29_004869 [Vitis rotundifolia]